MRSVPLGREPGDHELDAFRDLTGRPLLVVGNGPSSAMPRHDCLPADVVVFRTNWFFLESHYHFGRRVDAWFSAVPHEQLETMLADEIRTGRYDVGSVATPVRLPSERDTDRWGNRFVGLDVDEHDSWSLPARHARLARYYMSRPGLPTTGMQALAFGLAAGFREVYLAGIDLYESKTARYGYTVPEQVQATLTGKDLAPGYESSHALDVDLAFLRSCLVEFPDATVTHLGASETLALYLPGPTPLLDRPTMSPETVPGLGAAKARPVVELPGARAGHGVPDEAQAAVEVMEPADGRLWAERDGRRCAYVTIVSGDYHHGARALANSLRAVSDVPLLALCTPDADRAALLASGIHVIDVPAIVGPAPAHSGRVQDRFAATYTKLHAFRLGFLDRVVHVDSDAVVLQPVDELFDGDDFAAVPDAGLDLPTREHFNSGVFAVSPSAALFDDMMSRLATTASYDGGDQGFLNAYFPSWRALDPVFNTTKRIFSHHSALFDDDDVRVLHYVGAKPWQPGRSGGRYDELDARWLEHLRPFELHDLVRSLRDAAATSGTALDGTAPRGGRPRPRERWLDVERTLLAAWKTREPTAAELRRLARAYRMLGRYDESLAQLRRAVALAPGSTEIAKELRNARIRALYNRTPSLDRALRRLGVGSTAQLGLR